jgi:DNA-binding CsgD family transcriptional regulator/tetratricopeptide (TPR) repeat protein
MDRLIEGAQAGESAAIVIRGEPGIGKTALLQYCVAQARGCRVERIAAVESELDLPYAALHQLCAPMLANVSTLPEPQEEALELAFGLASGNAPDRFIVGLAVLGLLADVAAKQPLLCVVDDAHWLDEATSQVLGFVGRRLLAESVVLIVAVREPFARRLFPDLPDLTLRGLDDDEARALLAATVTRRLDERIRDRLIADTGGNPLAILELPALMSAAELAGGFGAPSTTRVPNHVREGYTRRINALPARTRQLMLLAAADPTGDATLVWRAGTTLGIGHDDLAAAQADQLFEIDSRVRFRHPLVRSAVYETATPEDRGSAHLALASATDPEGDPHRRAWHLGAAARGPNEDVAAELERTASSVHARAGLAAAASFLQRAVELTPDPSRRTDRALAAAHAHLQAGGYDAAREMLAHAGAVADHDLQRARVEQLRGQVDAAASPSGEASVRLLHAARRLETLDVSLARETYLQAWWAALLAADLTAPGGGLADISRAVRAASPPVDDRVCDVLLDGLATAALDGRDAAATGLRPAIDRFRAGQVSHDEWIQWGRSATTAAFILWDVDNWSQLSTRQVEAARSSGALAPLVIALGFHAYVTASCGDLDAAAAFVDEQTALREATGTHISSYGAQLLSAYQGRPADPSTASDGDVDPRGDGFIRHVRLFADAVRHNGQGRYADALAAADEPANRSVFVAPFALSELIEAAVRSGRLELAHEALERLSSMTVTGSQWSAGIEARGRALVSGSDAADHWYGESIACLAQTPLRPELARSQLVYGEWLRRQNRRVDARQQLRAAHESLAAMGAYGFAERARRELVATGEHVSKRRTAATLELTPQEVHIARLARDGRTNADIGAELFLSTRTVEWHLRKVFVKLGISSRRELKDISSALGR